jgi:hypothetical protein
MSAQNSHPINSFSNSPLFLARNQCTTLNNSPHLPRILIQNRHLGHSHSGSLYFASLKSLSSVSYVQVKVTWRYSIQSLWRVCDLRMLYEREGDSIPIQEGNIRARSALYMSILPNAAPAAGISPSS